MNIYVGNLSWNVEENKLQSIFEEHGTVNSVKIITDRFTGKKKGFGFVEMPNDEEATTAIEKLNGMELDQRAITVNVAQDRVERPRSNYGSNDDRGGGYNRGGGDRRRY